MKKLPKEQCYVPNITKSPYLAWKKKKLGKKKKKN